MPLRRFIRERRNAIPDDYIVFSKNMRTLMDWWKVIQSTFIKPCRILALKNG